MTLAMFTLAKPTPAVTANASVTAKSAAPSAGHADREKEPSREIRRPEQLGQLSARAGQLLVRDQALTRHHRQRRSIKDDDRTVLKSVLWSAECLS
jgi:hypothetical protein